MIAVAALAVSGCAGPRPQVVSQDLQPALDRPGEYHLTVTVRNRGRGEGECSVVARLRSRASGATVAQADGQVDLRPRETVPVTLTLQPSAPGPYVPETEVRYPPE